MVAAQIVPFGGMCVCLSDVFSFFLSFGWECLWRGLDDMLRRGVAGVRRPMLTYAGV